jgi:signal peptidase II
LFYGKVVDFLNVEFWDFTIFGHTYERWPIFNIADSSVTIGVLLLIIFHRESDLKEKKEEEIDDSAAELSPENSDENSEDPQTEVTIESEAEDKDGKDNNREDLQI